MEGLYREEILKIYLLHEVKNEQMHYLSLNRENVLVSNLEEQLINHTVA